MRVYKGAVLTCDEKNTVASYLVEDQGKIVYVGNELSEQYENADVTDLGKGALIPPFTDSHIHFASYAIFHAGLNVMEAGSNREILEQLKEYAERSEDKLLLAFGASPHSVSDKKLVTREELDGVCPDRPVFLVKYDGHACVVNTKLLNRVKRKVENLRGYHGDTGEMNQDAFFAVSDYVTNAVSVIRLVKNMQHAADHLASKGIGMIHTVSGVGFAGDMDVTLERWFADGLSNGLQMRVFFQTMDVRKALRRKFSRIGGCFETALDGCFGSKDAALIQPYEGTTDHGVLYYSDEKVIEFCKKANRANLQIQLHAIGDEAFRQAVLAISTALEDNPRKDHRHTIIHACLPTKEGIDLCRKHHILLAVQSAFIEWLQEPDAYLERILGKRSRELNPLRTFRNAGLVLSAGSDGPCTEPDPILWIHKACNHSAASQSLTVEEALRMCTYNGYFGTFDEKERGSLETGKYADMVILSENPYQTDTERLKKIKVKELILQGKPYQKVKTGVVGHILRGMLRKKEIRMPL